MSIIRNKIADYLEIRQSTETQPEKPVYALCGDGTLNLDENPNAKTESEIYVNQASASTEVTSYETKFLFTMNLDPKFPATYEIYKIATRQKLGDEAQRMFVRVELFEKIEGHDNIFPARRFKISIAVSGVTGAGGEKIKMNGELGTLTDAEVGYFNTETKEFLTELPEVTETSEP